MSLSNAHVKCGVSEKLFDDFLKAYVSSHKELLNFEINSTIQLFETTDDYPVEVTMKGRISLPTFSYREQENGYAYLAIDIAGSVAISIATDEAASAHLYTIPFEFEVRFETDLKPSVNGAAPKVGVQFTEIKVIRAPFTEEEIADIVQGTGLVAYVDTIALDVVTPMIGLIEGAFESEDGSENNPPHSAYPVKLRLLKVHQNNTPGIGIFVGRPGVSLSQYTDVDESRSFIPTYSEVTVVLASPFVMDILELLRNKVTDLVSGTMFDVEVKALTVDNGSIRFEVFGIEKEWTDSYATLLGKIRLSLNPGSTVVRMDVDFDLDVEPEGFAQVIDLFGSIESMLEEKLPGIAERLVESKANEVFKGLGESVTLDTIGYEGVDIDVYPQEIELDRNEVRLHVQVHSHVTHDHLKTASYSSTLNRFVRFEMHSGRKYLTKDLARFMQRNKMVVSGYHDVDGRYVRANPDDIEANNLLEQFQR
ncbi:MAG: hypothetical protein OCC49_05730 [Fibrobacterales bacterium]